MGYDAFLINGKKDFQALLAHPGEKIRLRVINAAASSYFYLNLGNIPMKVISADGIDIAPTMAKEILIGMAEIYDILFEVPEHKNYEFKASAQDGTGSASAWIGMGEKVFAPVKPLPDMFALMNHGAHGSMDHSKMDHSTMDHGAEIKKENRSLNQTPTVSHDNQVNIDPPLTFLTVNDLEAVSSTTLPKNKPVHDVMLELDGDMERYIWVINGKAIH